MATQVYTIAALLSVAVLVICDGGDDGGRGTGRDASPE